MKFKNLFSRLMKNEENWEHQIISSKQDLKEWLKYEKQKYTLLSGCPIPIAEEDYLWKYQKRLRTTEYYLNTGKSIRYVLSRVRLVKLGSKVGPNIRLNSCGKGLRFAHFGMVITNGDIGMDCTFFPNVLIGQSRGKTPILGNNVYVFTGSVVAGEIRLADNITIGANSVVTKSFEEANKIIAGAPAKVIDAKPYKA